ncbi:hypothetical protein JOB18_008624 [Solea senegalensis]|uniref:C2 domain-containing protein n=1 Tax=Solea senegalensis TaxID=28829 RepID=A0AAV6SES8_SOLSE|nr:hypothetical protein JOB18_008624 [Solea senegalensis]
MTAEKSSLGPAQVPIKRVVAHTVRQTETQRKNPRFNLEFHCELHSQIPVTHTILLTIMIGWLPLQTHRPPHCSAVCDGQGWQHRIYFQLKEEQAELAEITHTVEDTLCATAQVQVQVQVVWTYPEVLVNYRDSSAHCSDACMEDQRTQRKILTINHQPAGV